MNGHLLQRLARAENWARARQNLTRIEEAVFAALRAAGPCTTRELARRAGLSLLSVRPRVCDMAAAGLVECVGIEHREGVYRALSDEEIARALAAPVAAQTTPAEQMMLI